jgi:hypothetical protein
MSILLLALAFTPATTVLPDSYAQPLAFDAFLAPEPFAPAAYESHTEATQSLLSYTFIEVGAAKYDVDEADDDVDIFYGRGSIGFLGFLYGFGEYQNQSTDFENTDSDLITLGIGGHFAVTPQFDLFAEVGWLFADISSDLDDLDESDDGFEVAGGVRWLVLPWTDGGLELNGSVGTVDLDNRLGSDDNPFVWSVGARIHFLRMISIGLAYEMFEDDDQILGNVRVSF